MGKFFSRGDVYNRKAFKVWNFRYLEDPFDAIVTAYAILLSDAAYIRKKACLLLLKALVQDGFLSALIKNDVAPIMRDDARVARWAKEIKSSGICEICGATEKLEAHHILSWAEYPFGRVDTQNGICLCANCHANVHAGERAGNLIRARLRINRSKTLKAHKGV